MADLAFQYTHTSSQACFLFHHKVQTVKPNTTLHLITNSNLPFNFTSHSVMGVCSMLSQESSSEVLETPLSNVWHFKQILTFWLFRLSNGCLSSTGDSADLWLKFVSRGYSKLATCKKQSTPTALTAGTHTHRELTNCPPVAQTVAEATHTQQIFYYPSLLKTRAKFPGNRVVKKSCESLWVQAYCQYACACILSILRLGTGANIMCVRVRCNNATYNNTIHTKIPRRLIIKEKYWREPEQR